MGRGVAYTKEQILERGARVAVERGYVPTLREWDELRLKPAAATIRNRFGCWSAFQKKVGGGKARRRAWKKQRVLERLRAQCAENPSQRHWNALGLKPSAGTVVKYFGSWNAAVRAAGLKPRAGLSNNEILCGIARELDKHGSLTIERWMELGLRPDPVTIWRRFGSWQKAMARARKILKQQKVTQADALLLDVARASKEKIVSALSLAKSNSNA